MPTEMGDSPTVWNEPAMRYTLGMKKNSDGSLDIEMDDYLGGKWVAPVVNTAHATYMTLLSAVPTGKTAYVKAIVITNNEAYSLRVDIYQDTTLKFNVILAAKSSLGLSEQDLIGLCFTSATAIKYKTEVLGGEAWSAGTYVGIGYFLK